VPSLITRIKPYSDRSSQSVKTEKNQFAKHTPNHAGLSREDSMGRYCTLCYSILWDIMWYVVCGVVLSYCCPRSNLSCRIGSLPPPSSDQSYAHAVSPASQPLDSTKDRARTLPSHAHTHTHTHTHRQTDSIQQHSHAIAAAAAVAVGIAPSFTHHVKRTAD
jgi:hypothetical protein